MRRGLFLLFVAAACGNAVPPKPIAKPATPAASVSVSASASTTASAEPPADREHEPPLGPEVSFAMPQVKETKLANGLRILSANTGGGMFAMRAVFEGFAVFPAERAAAARVMVKSLFGGTPRNDAHALRRVLEKRFATWSTNITADSVFIDMSMPADDVRPCVEVIADVLENAGLDNLTIGFELLQIVSQGQTARENPQLVGYNALTRALYGDGHAYARSTTVLDGSANVDRVEVQRIYDEIIDPANATIVVAGAVDRPLLEYVEHQFQSWRSRAHAASTTVTVSARTGPRLVVVDRPGSVQSQITYGAIAPARSSADWYTMTMIHQLLGARRSSRLVHTLEVGSTHYEQHRAEGPFYWDSSVPIADTGKTLREIDKALRDIAQNPVTASELDERKALYVRQVPLWFETAHETADAISPIARYKLPTDALERIIPGIRAVTPDAVRALAQVRLAPDKTRAVVVGDWSKLRTELKALGWGPIEIRDVAGKVLRVEK
jgi:predicted Zn-dependent peptidase